MMLGYLARGIVLVLAGHAIVSTVAAVCIAWCWPRVTRQPVVVASRSANRLFLLRAAPTLAALTVAWFGLAVSYALWEPRMGDERVGPVALALAGLGAAVLISGVWRAWRALRQSARIQQGLRMAARASQPRLPVPAVVIDTGFPVVAVAGLFVPRLFVAHSVVEACTVEEIGAIVAHEHAHGAARDNLRRLALRGAPDVLAWTSAGPAIERDWSVAAELAADEVAARDGVGRLHLASALVKVARLAAAMPAATLPASALYRGEPIAERVRRLVEAPAGAAAVPPSWPPRVVALAVLAGAPLWMPAAYRAIETILKIGLI